MLKLRDYKNSQRNAMQNKSRPKYINLFVLAPKMGVTAKVSIFHRITGFLLFLSIPFVLFLLHKSLTSPNFYQAFYAIMSSVIAKIIYTILIFAFIFHMIAGVRFLFMDIHKGVEIKTAKITARIVMGLSIVITILLGVLIW